MTTRTDTRIDPRSLALFGFFVLFGAAVMRYPLPALILLLVIVVGAFTFYLLRVGRLMVWQLLALTALTGFAVLNYGFENICFHLGSFPIILGHSLMFAALGLAVLHYRHVVRRALAEPAMILILVLIALTSFHLVLDIPHYGLYALRDASLTFEGIFLLLGLLWATESRNTEILIKWLFLLCLIVLIYGYMYPWHDTLRGLPLTSGIFQPVPILGNYEAIGLFSTMGALFWLYLGNYFLKWRWLLLVLAAAQLFPLVFLQLRGTYVEIFVILLLLLLFGEVRKFAQLTFMLWVGLVVLVLLTSVVGLQMEGRVGPVSASFLEQHAEGLLGKSTAPQEGSIEDRREWYAYVWKNSTSSASKFLLGQGFGQPLIEFTAPSVSGAAVVVRQPHNSHLTFFARLGLLGATIWLIVNIYIFVRFLSAIRRRAYGEHKLYYLISWLFFYYVVAILTFTWQPGLEFSSGAITFYFLMGVAIGVIRWQMQPPAQVRRRAATPG